MTSSNYIRIAPVIGTLALTTSVFMSPVDTGQLLKLQSGAYIAIRSELQNYNADVIELTIFDSLNNTSQETETVIPLKIAGAISVNISKLNKIDFDWV